MRKLLHVLICFLPIFLLGSFYICLLGFDMLDGNIAGMLMVMAGAALSVLTPAIHILAGPFSKPRFRNRTFLLYSLLSGILYWLVCYLDFNHRLHQFMAS